MSSLLGPAQGLCTVDEYHLKLQQKFGGDANLEEHAEKKNLDK